MSNSAIIDPSHISDKSWDHGHRAHYLGGGSAKFQLSASDIQRMALCHELSDSDRVCVDEIIRSLQKDGNLPFTWTPQEQFFIVHNGEHQVIPYLVYRFKFRVLSERHAKTDFPIHLLIEPTSVCNLRCVMCFQTDRTFTKKSFMGQMDIGLYRNIIDQAVEGGSGAISIGSRGEPFLHPDIGEMLRYASGKGFFDLKINTNATKLGEAECHDILSSDVNLVALSIDAHEKKIYESIRVKGNFDTVLENVRRLRRIRDRDYPASSVELRVSGVKFREDQDVNGFNTFWSEICDTVVYVRALPRKNTYENPIDPDLTHPCGFLWNRLYVWHDGICNPCDEDYKSMLSPGNVHQKSIREIWNGESMERLRREHLAGSRGCFNPCDRCGV